MIVGEAAPFEASSRLEGEGRLREDIATSKATGQDRMYVCFTVLVRRKVSETSSCS